MAIELISTIKPKNNGSFPVVEDNDIKGGYHSVTSIAMRDAIPVTKRSPGMLCYVSDTCKIYKLSEDLTTWIEFTSGDGTCNNIVVSETEPSLEDYPEAVIWIDPTDDEEDIEVDFTNDIIEEFRTAMKAQALVIENLKRSIIALEETIVLGGGGSTKPDVPDDPDDPSATVGIPLALEDGSKMTFEDGTIMTL